MKDFEIAKILPATMAMVKRTAHNKLERGDFEGYAKAIAELAALEKTFEDVKVKLYLVK